MYSQLHTDKGLHNFANDLLSFLNKNGIVLSRTQNFKPYEKTVAERKNETVTHQFIIDKYNKDLRSMKQIVKAAIIAYN